ncbi:MAG: TonB-dependent receptor [Acidobacteriota bacterium]
MFSKKYLVSIFLLLVLIFTENTFAQLGTGSVRGTITDITNAVIGGAMVSIRNTATDQVRETVTRENGFCAFENLLPGVYEVKVQAPGFATELISNITVRVGEVVTIAGRLRPASTDITVEVSASQTYLVNTTSSEVAGVVSEQAVAMLPLNGRNFLDLGLLLPGNFPTPVFDQLKSNISLISSSGQSARIGNIAIDGADNNDDFSGGTLQNFPIDSIREFQIVNSIYGADKGRSSSSVVNVVTKSGTNEFHGSSIFFFRNDNLSAIPTTIDRQTINQLGRPPFDREQYAGALGGRLKRDRAWFFTAFEFRDQDGIVFAGQRDFNQRRVIVTYAPTELRDPLLLSRIDWQLGNSDSMFFRYGLQRQRFFDTAFLLRPSTSVDSLVKLKNNSQSFIYHWVHTFSPQLLNDFTINITDAENKVLNSSTQLEALFPTISEGPPNHESPQRTDQNRVQLRNNISLLVGNNAVKFGGEFHFISNSFEDRSFNNGVFALDEDFPSLDRNQDGKLDDLDIPVFLALSSKSANGGRIPDVDNKYLALYIQNDWRLKPNFTINLGLRYEVETNVTNRSNASQTSPIARALLPGQPQIDKNNFAPRIGFNWDPFGNGRTSIHGGYGISYSRILLLIAADERFLSNGNIFELRLGSELDDDGNFLPDTVTIANPFDGPIISQAFNFSLADPNLATPYVQQFNFGIQREIIPNLLISVDGVHTFGTKFIARRQLNPDPLVFAAVSSLKNWFDGLLVKVEKRPSQRFSLLASYTLSKALVMTQDDQFALSADMTPDRLLKGPAANDIQHRFSLAGVLDLPYGIQIAPIYTLESDVAFDVLDSTGTRLPFIQVNAAGRQFHTGAQLNDFIRQINMGGGVNGMPLPFVQNDLKFGDSFSSLDMRITKSFKVTENVNLQIIGEVFNLFNITNLITLQNFER